MRTLHAITVPDMNMWSYNLFGPVLISELSSKPLALLITKV